MTVETKNWTQKTRDRFRACSAKQYLIDVAEGTEEGSMTRLRASEYIVNKVLPNPPASVITHESDKPPDFNVIHQDN